MKGIVMGNRTRKKTVVVALVVMGFALIALMTYGAYRFRQRLHHSRALVDAVHGDPTPERLLQYLSYDDPLIVSNSLTRLEHLKNPIARARAIELLEHPDPYVWGPACMYLGAIETPESVPFLIKGLRHPAWQSHDRMAQYLRDLTGESFGKDQEPWIKWWRQENPGKSFNFAIDDT